MKTTNLLILIGAGVVGMAYFKNKALETVGDIGTAVNPTNNENIFYTGVNGVGTALTGDKNFSLGGWIYDATH